MPSPVGRVGRASLFGAWLYERIVSISLDWPCVAFHRIELVPDGVRLALLGPRTVPPTAVALAVSRAIRRELQAEVQTWCGLRDGRAVFKPEFRVVVDTALPEMHSAA
ncbi:MAG: hypothetical protein ACREK8_07375 [Gemmatimonadales bacterium]